MSINEMAAAAADEIIRQQDEMRHIATGVDLKPGYLEDMIRKMMIVQITKVGQDVRGRIAEAMSTL